MAVIRGEIEYYGQVGFWPLSPPPPQEKFRGEAAAYQTWENPYQTRNGLNREASLPNLREFVLSLRALTRPGRAPTKPGKASVGPEGP